ncbi:MAG: oligosaccharide flippase family protein [Oscillospiraceae bacterium]|nr:oligosaccharide flippase family protein [Oscillospiraceae bacterium]
MNKHAVFLKDVAVLSVGQGLAQIIPALITPFTARLYTPKMQGEFALYISAINILSQVCALKYDHAVSAADNIEDSAALAMLSMVISFLSAVMLICLFPLIFKLYGSLECMYYLPIGVLMTMTELVFVALGISHGDFYIVSAALIFRALVWGAFQIILYRMGTLGLIFSRIAGDAAGAVLIARCRCINFSVWKKISEVKRKYASYPRYMLPGAAVGALSGNTQSFFISSFYGAGQMGYSSMAERLLGIPVAVFSASLGRVFVRKAVNDMRNDGRVNFSARVVLGMSAVSAVVFGGIWLVAPYIVPFVLGDEWKEAAGFIRVQTILYAVKFVAVPLTVILPVLNEQRSIMLWQFLMLLLGLVVPVLHIIFGFEILVYLLCSAVLLSLGYVLFGLYCLAVLKKGG